MENGRCLLDVINDPQLLQSFLESESSTSRTTTTSVDVSNNNNNNAEYDNHHGPTTTHILSRDFCTPQFGGIESRNCPETAMNHLADIDTVKYSPDSNVIKETLDFIKDVVEEGLPQSDNHYQDQPLQTFNQVQEEQFTQCQLEDKTSQDQVSKIYGELNSYDQIDDHSKSFFSNPTDCIKLENVDQQEPRDHPTTDTVETVQEAQSISLGSETNPHVPPTTTSSIDVKPLDTNVDNVTLSATSITINSTNNNNTAPSTMIPTSNSTTANTTTTSTATTPTSSTTTVKAPAKRAPRRANPRATKGKSTKTNDPAPAPNSQVTPTSQPNSALNVAPNVPTSMSTSNPTNPTYATMPQQRIIQIQTANGPMYFALAPGPGPSNPVASSQTIQSQARFSSPQPGQMIIQNRPMMFNPSQQLIRTTGNNIIVNGSPVTMATQPGGSNQQSTRLGHPIMTTSQPMTIGPSQNTQRPLILPNYQTNPQTTSSQPMMMPRMPNQVILNSPMGAPGQVFAVQTPNGPMLFALQSQPTMQPAVSGPTTLNNPMIDYNNQIQTQHKHDQHQQLIQSSSSSHSVVTDSQVMNTNSSNIIINNGPKPSGLDLDDLLMDCGIVPDERLSTTQSPTVKISQSPSLHSTNSPMPTQITPTIQSPLGQTNYMSQNSTPMPQSQPSLATYTGQPSIQQQPVTITIGPDGQMIMQPTMYSSIRPMIQSNPMNQQQITSSNNNMVTCSSPLISPMDSTKTPPTPITNTNQSSKNETNVGKKTKAVGNKRSRSKKSDQDKFPTLKTPKLQEQKQKQQETQMQGLTTILPTTTILQYGDQNSKSVLPNRGVMSNVNQLCGSQQISTYGKIVTCPVFQTGSIQPLAMNSNMIQATGSATLMDNQTQIVQSIPAGSMNTSIPNTQICNLSSRLMDNTITTSSTSTTIPTSSAASNMQHLNPSGNVPTNNLFRKIIALPRTVDSNPHISSSLTPTPPSPMVDNPKHERNGSLVVTSQVKDEQPHTMQTTALKGTLQTKEGPVTATIIITPTAVLKSGLQTQPLNQPQLQTQPQPQTQSQRPPSPTPPTPILPKKEILTRSVMNQLNSDQKALLNPPLRQPFESLEDACKKLLRYHMYDSGTLEDGQLVKFDQIFEAAAESLLQRRDKIFTKFRSMSLKQSMRSKPLIELVMLEQLFINDEQWELKNERELYKRYEAHLENLAFKQGKFKGHFAFGDNSSPDKLTNQFEEVDSSEPGPISKDSEDWPILDRWAKPTEVFSAVPDSEAATAIESLLNEDMS